MAKVGDSAFTDHGVGRITEGPLNERGRLSWRVAGAGFDVWVEDAKLRVAKNDPYFYAGLESTIDAGDVNDDNSVTLPWDPSPQYHDDLFRDEQTILPGDYEIDPDKRLHPSDSLSFDKRTDVKGPQPSPALFATPGGENPFANERTSSFHYAEDEGKHNNLYVKYQGDEGRHRAPEPADHHALPNEYQEGDTHWVPMSHEEYHSYVTQDPSYSGGNHETFSQPLVGWDSPEASHQQGYHPGQPIGVPNRSTDKQASVHEANPALMALLPALGRGVAMGAGSEMAGDLLGGGGEEGGEDEEEERRRQLEQLALQESPLGMFQASYRPAGLDKRYAYFDTVDMDYSSPVAQFRRDPVATINHYGHLWTDGDGMRLEARFGDETNLMDADSTPVEKTAAWRDVASKAKRLRTEGKVKIHDIGHNRIYATVEGDHGVYDVMLAKSGALGNSQTVADWVCGCEWGRWAFKRTMTYVGRLCSHAYAAYQAMQSQYLKDNPEHFTKKNAASVDEYKGWLDDTEKTPEPASIASYLNTKGKDADQTDAEKLYGWANNNTEQVPERDYKKPNPLTPDEAYKTGADADLLRQRPVSLSPNLREVPEGEDSKFVDVTKDDRETTGPDQIVHFSAIAAALHRTAEDEEPRSPFDSVSDWVQNDMLDNLQSPFTWNSSGEMGQANNSPLGFQNPFGGGDKTPDVPSTPEIPKAPSGGREPGWGGAPGSPAPAPDASPAGKSNTPGLATPSAAADAVKPPSTPGAPSGAPEAPGAGGGDGVWKANDIAENSIKPGDYKINQGDTLAEIAQGAGYGDNYQELARQNGIADPDKINAGDTLKIPGLDNAAPGGGSDPNPNPGPLGEMGNKGFEAVKPDMQTQGFDAVKQPDALPTTPGQPPAEQGGSGQAPINAAGEVTPVSPTPPTPTPVEEPGKTGSRRYAESSDSALLDKLRDLSTTPAADDLGHMDEHNDELRDVVDELQDRGYDASFMVAALDPHWAATDPRATDGDPNFLGQSAPPWADEPAAGSGPAPKNWISDSVGYVEEHERPHIEEDWFDAPEGDIIKFNDSRSKPQQGPAHTGGFSLEAFDRGEFAPEGDLRRAGRVGRGPQSQVRIDPGTRDGRLPGQPPTHTAAAPPEDFGYDGGLDMSAYADDGATDIVAAFQRSGAAGAVMSENRGGGGNDDIAAYAQAFLRTAGRKYSPQEQRELEAEFHPQGARNLPDDDDLAGTHYLMGL